MSIREEIHNVLVNMFKLVELKPQQLLGIEALEKV